MSVAWEASRCLVEFGGGDLVERVTDLRFTTHALKKARRRFGLRDDDEAAEWLADRLEEATKHRPTREGGNAHLTPEGVELITQERQGVVLVVTVYPKQERQSEMKRRRRREFRMARLREV